MDVVFVSQGVEFTWDADKARTNLRRHDGITFEQAVEAFFDPFLKVVDASRNDEARDAIIGMDKRWNLLFVVYVEVGGRSHPPRLRAQGNPPGAERI